MPAGDPAAGPSRLTGMRGFGGAVILASLMSLGTAGLAGQPRQIEYDTLEWRVADSSVVVTGRIRGVVHKDVQEPGAVSWDTVSLESENTFKGAIAHLVKFRIQSDARLDKWKSQGTPLLLFLSESRRFHSRAASLFQFAPHTGFVGGSIVDLSTNSGAAILTEHDGFVTGAAAILRHLQVAVAETRAPKYTSHRTTLSLIDGLGGPGNYTVDPLPGLDDSAEAEGPVVRLSSTSEFDGNTIASAQDKLIKLWDVRTGKLIRTFGPSLDPMLSVAVSPDGTHIVGGSGSFPYPGAPKDNRIRVWDVASGALENQTPTHGPVSEIAFVNQDVAGGGRIITTSKEDYSGEGAWRQRMWDTWNLDDYMIFPGTEPRVSPDGSMVLTIHPQGWVGVWDANTFEQLSTISAADHSYRDFHSAEFSPYGDRVVTTSVYSVGLEYQSSMDVWDAQTGKLIFSVPASRVTRAVYTNDGHHIVTASRDGVLAIYNAEDGRLERAIQLQGKEYGLLVSPDGTRALLKWGPDSYITKADHASLFDLGSGRQLMHIDGDVSGLVGFSRDGGSLFGFGEPKRGKLTGTVWNSVTGAVMSSVTLE